MADEFEPRYDPQATEENTYRTWEESGFFNPDICIEKGITSPDAESFSIVLPPPNVTGTLHIGHAFEDAVQDTIVRYKRMTGKRTLWVPGTDHAAIATQAKVEKLLEKEGKKKYDLGREAFLERVNAFAQESHDTIVKQIRRMGASLDWSREAYTLDEKRNRAVKTAFKKLHELGLVYRGDRVVNWDPKGQTVISDDEIVYQERTAILYTFTYSPDFPIAISTTRPETKFGDTAVAVHPDDERYRAFIGKEYDITFCGEPLHIKIIADQSVEKDFGTGALGVTPAHSMIDWEIAQRHDLPLKQVIDERARMTVAGEINGKKTEEARTWVVRRLKEQNLIKKEEEIPQNVATAERTGGIVEPLPKLQWFLDVDAEFTLEHSNLQGIPSGSTTTLKKLMRQVVETGQVAIIPERFRKNYFNWIDNLRDWCLSRQIWFGHRIPAWYRSEANETYIGMEAPEGDGWEQDPDTFDTWFSSGLWPFSTLGWPDKTPDLTAYFPNVFMSPGYEILYLWVSRMILMSGALMGDIPFRTAYIHGIVRDTKGEKFSKSKGNGIDPLDLAAHYGADAIRMALIVGAAPGNDVKFDEQRVKGYRNFSTKIWNIGRFIAMNRNESEKPGAEHGKETYQKYLAEFETIKSDVTAHIENFEFHLAAEKAYHYVWHTFADVIIEAEKETLKNGIDEEKAASYAVLEAIFLGSLKLLHPFMPFITEAAWQKLRPGTILMVEKW